MRTVTSKDGTPIAFDKTGRGSALILVVGAFNDRMTGVPLTEILEQHFTVYNYDRRGRGDSGDTQPYGVEREIEDLDALIAEAGGSAFVFGYSSGAVLSLKAAARGSAITKLVLYDPPLMLKRPENVVEKPVMAHMSTSGEQVIEVNSSREPFDDNLASELDRLVSAGRRGDAVELFQTKCVGIPNEVVVGMRNAPFRPMLEKMAHTLVYEMTILGNGVLPADFAASISAPLLVMVGGNGPSFMQDSAKVLANESQAGQYRILEGQTHDIVPAVVAPIVEEFLVK